MQRKVVAEVNVVSLILHDETYIMVIFLPLNILFGKLFGFAYSRLPTLSRLFFLYSLNDAITL